MATMSIVLALTACGVSAEDYEAAQASASALNSEKEELVAQLADTKSTLDTVQAEADSLRAAEEERLAEEEAAA
ncbi:hypothetical protein AS038_01250 [Arthrobacter sp. NIO-1057]|nr:hypothetical protein AS038_01250 [Arthrobacter sp. NIO-1057]